MFSGVVEHETLKHGKNVQTLQRWPALIAVAAHASIPGRCNNILHLAAKVGIRN